VTKHFFPLNNRVCIQLIKRSITRYNKNTLIAMVECILMISLEFDRCNANWAHILGKEFDTKSGKKLLNSKLFYCYNFGHPIKSIFEIQ
jgi:hypothetical protein